MSKVSSDEQKIIVANFAVDYLVDKNILHSNMKIGLGTGSTAVKVVERLAEYIQKGMLQNIVSVSTSFQTMLLCEKLNIPVYSLNAKQIGGKLDFTIDGADEVTPDKCVTKGGGAALLLEKIVAYNSEKYFIVATKSKCVKNLGISFPIPIEIIGEARTSCIAELKKLGAECTLREGGVPKQGPVITDNGNMILDARFREPFEPKLYEDKIKLIAGVVEVGLFTKNIPTVFLSDDEGNCSVL
jgi:ribose 5-phosphate isomerase A